MARLPAAVAAILWLAGATPWLAGPAFGQSIFSPSTRPAAAPVKLTSSSAPAPEAASADPVARAVAESNALAARLWSTHVPQGAGEVFGPFGHYRAARLARALSTPAPAKPLDADPTRSLADRLVAGSDLTSAVRLSLSIAAWAPPGPATGKAAVARFKAAYGSELRPLDRSNPGAAADELSTWVAQATGEAITRAVPTSAVVGAPPAAVTDAVEFVAQWDAPFDPALTADRPFTPTGAAPVAVPTMHMTANVPYHRDADGVEVVALAYAPPATDPLASAAPADAAPTSAAPTSAAPTSAPALPRFALVCVLPPVGTDLTQLRAGLTADRLADWLAKARPPAAAIARWEAARPDSDDEAVLNRWVDAYPMHAVSVALPRFAIKSPAGMLPGWAADPARGGAAFGQGCTLAATERGTAGAEAPELGLTGGSIGPAATFAANRPFLVAVVDQTTGLIILVGSVEAP